VTEKRDGLEAERGTPTEVNKKDHDIPSQQGALWLTILTPTQHARGQVGVQ
jgi:hypothetical protein